MTQQEFSAIANTIPLDPGIYKYYDGTDELLYVGKPKIYENGSAPIFSTLSPVIKQMNWFSESAKLNLLL